MMERAFAIIFPFIYAAFMTVSTYPLPSTPSRRCQTWQWQGYCINYTVEGEGQPLVLLHGFGASIGHWRKNIPAWAAAGYQVFAIDLLGFGASDKPDRVYSMALWRELVEDFWREKIDRPAVFVGNSIGGLLALMVVADRPDLAFGGILLNPAGGLSHRPEELNPVLSLVLRTFAKVAALPVLGPFLFNQVRQPKRIRNSLRQVYYNQTSITDELVDILYQPSCDPGAQQVFAAIIGADPGPTSEMLLAKLDRPLLVLWGDADPWTPIGGSKPYRELMETKAIALVPIPQTGHCPHDENPAVVNPQVLDWLRRQGF
jgi:pimeloyl-ACP methyl ester carboxylesterase